MTRDFVSWNKTNYLLVSFHKTHISSKTNTKTAELWRDNNNNNMWKLLVEIQDRKNISDLQ